MLDIKYFKKNLGEVKKLLSKKGVDPAEVDKLLLLYDKWTDKLGKYDDLRAKRNKIAHGGKYSEEGKKLKKTSYDLEQEVVKAYDEYKRAENQIPNLPSKDVQGGNQDDFKILKEVGKRRDFGFDPKDHLTLGENLNLIDTETASKVSGSRFAYLKNELVFLEFALVQHAFSFLKSKGFEAVLPPVIIKKEITEGLGYWHGKIDQAHTSNENYYLVYDPKEDQPNENPENYLVGTAEHAIVPMFMNKKLSLSDLPKRIVAFSPAFRREAGTYGKDTRGIFRVHQFEKVEMVVFTKNTESEKYFNELVSLAEELMYSLELPYRVIQLAAGDISFPSAKTVDIETWIPSQGTYRETHSISNTTDFQSRRLNIKYIESKNTAVPGEAVLGDAMPGAGSTTNYTHILNGTAFAIGRTLIAIMENYQQKDGSILVPKILQKYTNFNKIPA